MSSVCGPAVVTVPTLHAPVPAMYVPWLGVAETNVRPAGNRSWTTTFVAESGPLLVRVTVKVTVSPTLGVALLTVLLTATSARCGVSVALALLLPAIGSNWSLWLTVAVFVWPVELTTRAVMVSVWAADGSMTPTSHTPVAG